MIIDIINIMIKTDSYQHKIIIDIVIYTDIINDSIMMVLILFMLLLSIILLLLWIWLLYYLFDHDIIIMILLLYDWSFIYNIDNYENYDWINVMY